MKVLFATAELRPLVSAGGLGEAAAGLTAALRDRGLDVLTVLPDYHRWPLTDEQVNSIVAFLKSLTGELPAYAKMPTNT